jgi:hypothetical protein
MTSAVAPASAAQTSPAYQTMLVGLLGVNLGIEFLDRFATGGAPTRNRTKLCGLQNRCITTMLWGPAIRQL